MYGLRRIWKPEIFQGARQKEGYFEGWYFKCISRDEGEGHVFIPGVAYSKDDAHAFLQIFDGKRETYEYVRYPLQDFRFSKKIFHVTLGENTFSSEGFHLHTRFGDGLVEGDVSFSPINPWPVTLFSPGAMGWYTFVPTMEDYHGVLSFNHSLFGSVRFNRREVDFTGGLGYLEKDWGVSFPERWIWMQSNHFPEEAISISLSIATIPWKKKRFTGYIIGVWIDGRLFSFSTYSGAVIKEYRVVSSEKVELLIRSKKYELRVVGTKMGGTDLKAPVVGLMSGHVHESLVSEIEVLLKERGAKGTVFEGTGRNAGVELHGDIDGLLADAVA